MRQRTQSTQRCECFPPIDCGQEMFNNDWVIWHMRVCGHNGGKCWAPPPSLKGRKGDQCSYCGAHAHKWHVFGTSPHVPFSMQGVPGCTWRECRGGGPRGADPSAAAPAVPRGKETWTAHIPRDSLGHHTCTRQEIFRWVFKIMF